MKRPVLFILLAVACSTAVFGQEVRTPPAVKRILDKATAEVKKNRQEFDRANAKPLGNARQELQDLSTKLIKDGKTAEAQAVLKQVDTLDHDVMRQANAPPPVTGGGGAGPQKLLLERLAGRWRNANMSWTTVIDASGTVREVNAEGRVTNEGRISSMSASVAEVTLSSGHKLHLRPAGDDALAVLVWTPEGKEYGEGRCLVRAK